MNRATPSNLKRLAARTIVVGLLFGIPCGTRAESRCTSTTSQQLRILREYSKVLRRGSLRVVQRGARIRALSLLSRQIERRCPRTRRLNEPTVASVTELIVNGSFETGADGWQLGGLAMPSLSTLAHSGKFSLELARYGLTFAAQQHAIAPERSTFELSAFVSGRRPFRQASAALLWLTNEGALVRLDYRAQRAIANGTWGEIRWPVMPPRGAERVKLMLIAPDAALSLVDSVSLRQILQPRGGAGTPTPTATAQPTGTGSPMSTATPTSIPTSTATPWIPQPGDYVMPIGVPDNADIRVLISSQIPPTPVGWNSNIAGFYFVQPGGSNQGNGYPGSPAGNPPSPIPAGSVVVMNGTFTSWVNFSGTGTSSQPIFITSANLSSPATFYDDVAVRGSYVILDHVKIAAADPQGSGTQGEIEVLGDQDSDHIALRYSDISGNLGGGDLVPRGRYIAIFRNYIHDKGDLQSPIDQDAHCIAVPSRASYIYAIGNIIARCSGNGIQVNAGDIQSQSSTHHIFIGDNEFDSTRQPGIGLKQHEDGIISQNRIHGIRECVACGHVAGYGIGFQYGPERTWFLFNHIYDTEGGISGVSNSGMGYGTTTYLIGNVIHDVLLPANPAGSSNLWSTAGIGMPGGVPNKYILGNTLYNVPAGIKLGSGNLYVQNNIVSRLSTSDGRLTQFESAPITYSNNILDPTGNAALFVDSAARDFHLPATSSARNAGADALYESVASEFESRYGVSIRRDFDGLPRPREGALDIGAFEY